MHILTRQMIFCSVVIACASVTNLNSQTIADRKPATGSVSGTVTIKGKGAAGITVVLRKGREGILASYEAKTDQDGHYRISNVPPGTYQVGPYVPTFVVSRRLDDAPLMLSEGESIDGLNFSLTKGAVITGRVTNSDGQPIVDQQVRLVPADQNDGNYRVDYAGGQTDDRGVYRIFRLAEGKYKVFVGDRARTPRRGSINQTFHPGVSNSAKAATVEVSEGGEVTDIDISVDTYDTSEKFSLMGRIIDGVTGQPVPNLRVVARGDSGTDFMGAVSTSDNRGQFKIEILPPGKYEVLLEQPTDSDVRGDNIPVEIVDRDVAGVVIKTYRGASVSGEMLFEGDDKIIRASSQFFTFGVSVQPSKSMYSGKSVRLAQDMNFYIAGLDPGVLSFYVYGHPGGQLPISRIERDGVVQPRIEVKDGDRVTGLKVFVSVGTGSIRGIVKAENGELPPNSSIQMWLTQTDTESSGDRRLTIPVPSVDLRGRFVVNGLPQGTYDVSVYIFIQGARGRPPSAKRQVTVSDGVVSEVTIPVDLSPVPELF